uniref:FAD-dependent oxidoreductase domain-containing protein 2 n=1 Tax=Macrostomum lignano TaxID=282301 RepID=A0A1I8FSE0_9PLAT
LVEQILLVSAVFIVLAASQSLRKHEYCVIGAGPAGLQLGYFLRAAEHDYAIIERGDRPGAFFETYPRHDTLISINKRRTDSRNTEYSLRHDWNSLLSNDEQMQMRYYSIKMFPKRQDLLLYLKDFKERFNLNVHFKTEVTGLHRLTESSEYRFSLETSQGQYHCQVHTSSYDDMSLNPADYENKRVLIIGKGNTAFETAAHIYGRTKLIHLMSRNRVRLAWSTHYVGDVRAVNNELLDTYQLKSIDGLLEYDANDLFVLRRPDGSLAVGPKDLENDLDQTLFEENTRGLFETKLLSKIGNKNSSFSVELEGEGIVNFNYDVVIRANGFEFDRSWLPNVTTVRNGKYPKITPSYESTDIPGLYFAGTLTHSLDYRKAAGGFIHHGFRYTVRALQRHLDAKRNDRPWPSLKQPLTGLIDTMVRRINEGSGNYQMFQNLGDVFIVDSRLKLYITRGVPLRLLPSLPSASGHPVGRDSLLFVFAFEYGKNFSGPALDVFHEERASCSPEDAYECNFLHPVIYQYNSLPTDTRKPDAIIHLVEDLHTNFRGRSTHLEPLAAFLEAALKQPMYPLSLERCAMLAVMHGSTKQQSPVCGGSSESRQDSAAMLRGWSAADMMQHGWKQK